MAGPILGTALGILVLALPFIVLAMLLGGVAGGLSLAVRGAAGRPLLLAAGAILLSGSAAALLSIRTWATTCPPAGADSLNPHRLVHEQTEMIRNYTAAMQATRRGSVIGMKLGGGSCRS